MANRKIAINAISKINAESIRSKNVPEVIRYLDTSSITKNRIEKVQILDSRIEPFPSRAQRKVKNKTIIYSTVRPEQEHFGIIEKENEDLIVSSGFLTIDIIDKEIDPKYLYYLITRKDITNHLQRVATNNVSAYPSINPDDLGSMEFVIPSDLSTQQKIAAVLTALDAKIELNQRINAELESMAKTLYDYWFVQFDFPNEKGKPYKSAGGGMVWNETLKREIPLGWSDGMISDFADVIDPHPSHRAPIEVKEGFPFAGIGDIDKEGNIDLSKARVINEDFVNKQENDYEITNNSIGYGRVGTVGKVVKLRRQSFRYAISPTLSIINPKERYAGFVYFTVNDNNFYNMVIRKMSGSTRPAVGIQELRKIPVIAIPEKHASILAKFELIASYCIKQADIINKESQTLTELRDWLLPMLMNGQVKVN